MAVGGFRLEDLPLVTENGAETLTDFDDALVQAAALLQDRAAAMVRHPANTSPAISVVADSCSDGMACEEVLRLLERGHP